MTSAVHASSAVDQTDVPLVVRRAVMLGLFEAVLVFVFSLMSRMLDGTPELAVRSLIVLVGLAATSLLPGIWTRARTIEGIAGAAGIGLAATGIFMVVDALLLQRIGTYTSRWLAIGGGSNWWYHPVWWMTGTFLAWMGAWSLAHQAEKGGTNPVAAFLTALVFTAIAGTVGVFIGVPHAGWNLGTFSVAFLPGIALTALVTGLGGKRT